MYVLEQGRSVAEALPARRLDMGYFRDSLSLQPLERVSVSRLVTDSRLRSVLLSSGLGNWDVVGRRHAVRSWGHQANESVRNSQGVVLSTVTSGESVSRPGRESKMGPSLTPGPLFFTDQRTGRRLFNLF